MRNSNHIYLWILRRLMRPNESSIPALALLRHIAQTRPDCGKFLIRNKTRARARTYHGQQLSNHMMISQRYLINFLPRQYVDISHRIQHMLRKRYLSNGCTLWTYIDPACLPCLSLALMTQGGVVKINHNEGLVVTPTVSIHMIRPCHAMSCHVSCLMPYVSSRVSSCRVVSYHISYYITSYHIWLAYIIS